MIDLVQRLNDPYRRLTVSDRQEAATAITRMHDALLSARRAILREAAPDEADALNAIDTVLGDPALSSQNRAEPK